MSRNGMDRRKFLKGVASTAAVAALPVVWPGRRARARGSSPPRARNVLLLLADQHRQEMLGHRGMQYALTPAIDRLARTGTTFENAFCQSPLCVPGRTSLLLGRWVHSHGVTSNQHLAPPQLPSFPQVLREHGFVTACYGKLHVPGRSELDWDFLDEFLDRERPVVPEGGIILGNLLQGGQPLGQPAPFGDEFHADWLAKEASIEFLRRHRDDSWFLQCSFEKPHPAFQPPRRHWDRVDRARLEIPRYPKDDLDDVSPLARQAMTSTGLENVTDEELLDAMQGYLGNIAFVDELFGEVLETLESLGLADDTVVLYTADSGEMLGAHHLWKKFAFFDEAVRVPLSIRWPGHVAGGRIVSALVAHADLCPTILDLAGVPVPATVQGTSLVPFLLGEADGPGRAWVGSELGNRAMHRGPRWKLVENGPDEEPELYDLETDPREVTNVAARPENAERRRELRAELADWLTRDVVEPTGTTAPRKPGHRERNSRPGRTR